MHSPSRRAFLFLVPAAAAAAAIGASGIAAIDMAEAMPIAPTVQRSDEAADLETQQVQWGPPPRRRPPHRRPRHRRRRWVCWWHRGRRHCAWRW
jgi:hypothetical protein